MGTLSKFPQMLMHQGIQTYGMRAIEATLKEFVQLNNKKIFSPLDAEKLTTEQKKAALPLITMIKEKRNGKIKGRACADGRKQRRYIAKEDVRSPTIQLESLILSLAIDAHERRDEATADVVGAFLLEDIKEHVIIKITETSVELMCEANKKYRTHVKYERGKPVLYMKLLKALYGCMQSALLWYQTFSNKLEKMGFILNPYDPCVANMNIEGYQCTICWYVDDVKISHKDSKVVDRIIAVLNDEFGDLTVTRGESTYTLV